MFNIDTLRKSNHRVRVCHLRKVVVPEATTRGIRNNERLCSKSEIEELIARNVVHYVSPTGGFTRVEVTTPEGKILRGSTYCNETFNRKRGLQVALGRAFSQE